MLDILKSGDKMRLPRKSGQVTVSKWVNATTLSQWALLQGKTWILCVQSSVALFEYLLAPSSDASTGPLEKELIGQLNLFAFGFLFVDMSIVNIQIQETICCTLENFYINLYFFMNAIALHTLLQGNAMQCCSLLCALKSDLNKNGAFMLSVW